MNKLIAKAQLKLMGLKEKMKKMKGEVNTVEVLVIIAVFLIITYPLYKGMISDFMSAVQTWFGTQEKVIFK